MCLTPVQSSVYNLMITTSEIISVYLKYVSLTVFPLCAIYVDSHHTYIIHLHTNSYNSAVFDAKYFILFICIFCSPDKYFFVVFQTLVQDENYVHIL